MTGEASARGRASRRRGVEAERAVAGWFRGNGWPAAERAVRTGYRTSSREVADPGDITGMPGIVVQVKDQAREDIAAWMVETGRQRIDAGAAWGLLVVRRRGTADVGRWWVWLPLAPLFEHLADWSHPGLRREVRMELAGLVPLLHAAGYGTVEGVA